jgi:hypothetical protein
LVVIIGKHLTGVGKFPNWVLISGSKLIMPPNIEGSIGIAIFILWQFKMHFHFKALKSQNKVEASNYLMFLLSPFTSGYYHMLITIPVVFSSQGNKDLVKSRYMCFIIYTLFITFFALDFNLNG